MKRFALLLALLAMCAPPVRAEAGASVTTLRAVAALSNAQASQHLRVSFEATVTYDFESALDIDVQDGDAAIFVKPAAETALVPGDRVRVEGMTEQSFLPYIANAHLTFLRHGAVPDPAPASFDDLTRTKLNCRLVRVRGIVRTADIVPADTSPTGRLQLLMDGGYVELNISRYDAAALKNLLDAEVEVTGVAGRLFDGKMQQTGVKIKASSVANIQVLQRAAADPWNLPFTPLGQGLTAYHVRDLSQRIRVHGTVTYYLPGAAAVLENETSSLWISTQSVEPLQIGDVAEAIGFPAMGGTRLSLVHAEIADSHVQAPIRPQEYSWGQLALWAKNNPRGHQLDLVSIQGRVVTEVREAAQDDFVLLASGRLFTAVYSHPPPTQPLPDMLQVAPGSTVRVTGVCMIVDSTPFNDEAPFNILLRSFSDIEVVARPSPLNVRNLVILAASLLVLVFAVGARSWYLERKRRRETAALAYLERRRSQVLEDLNSSRPLKEIIEQITGLVSFKLRGAASWCEIKDGPSFGQRPAIITSQRIVVQEIRSRSGVSMGTLFAAIPRFVKTCPDESAALALGTGLAKLAIETSNLYRALVYRSEFDLLTDIPNRFSLEKQLERLIHEARTGAGVFGFVFIDLDRFKQINDQYGHQAGDVYLQEVAQRMKRQLRPEDMLARLGGDEFAVVVQSVRNRTEVEEIASRLERCFDEPFAVEGREVHGSASVGIALYPEDATDRDGLLNTADAAMYVAKQSRKSIGVNASGDAAADLASMRWV
jgi:diguanylate cyclase (GGDEF)-like protein